MDNASILEVAKTGKLHKVYELTEELVTNICKKYIKYSLHEDLLQEGRMALYYAILSFNPERTENFVGWILPKITKAIGIAAYKMKKYNETVELTRDANKLLKDHMIDPREDIINEDCLKYIHSYISNTEDVPKRLFNSFFSEKPRFSQEAKSLGMSKERADNILGSLLIDIRNSI